MTSDLFKIFVPMTSHWLEIQIGHFGTQKKSSLVPSRNEESLHQFHQVTSSVLQQQQQQQQQLQHLQSYSTKAQTTTAKLQPLQHTQKQGLQIKRQQEQRQGHC
jgi:hypothetical protein